eukprot:gene9686-1892_t
MFVHISRQRNFLRKYSKKVPGFVLDVDGVLWHEKKFQIPTAKESLHFLKEKKFPFIILTNSGGCLEEERAKDLSEMFDIEISPKQIILSHTPMKSLVEKYGDSKVLIVGSRKSSEVAKQYGFEKSIGVEEYAHQNPHLFPKKVYQKKFAQDKNEEPFKAVLVLHDPDDFGQDLQITIDVLRSNGIPGQHSITQQDVNLYMSNPDFLYASTFAWPRFGQGLFKFCLQKTFKEVTNHELRINQFGKPEKISYDFAHKLLHDLAMEEYGTDISEIYAIGDNPKADIRGAVNAGGKFQSVLVRSGVFKGDNCDIDPAHHVVDVIGDFVLKKFDK